MVEGRSAGWLPGRPVSSDSKHNLPRYQTRRQNDYGNQISINHGACPAMEGEALTCWRNLLCGGDGFYRGRYRSGLGARGVERLERKSGVSGKGGCARVYRGGRRVLKEK